MTGTPIVEASDLIKERLAVFSEACSSQDTPAAERALLEIIDSAFQRSVDMEALSAEAASSNRVREVTEAVEGAIRRHGPSAPIHECLSRLWRLEGALPLALYHAKAANSIDPSSAFAHSALGQCLFQQGQFEQGLAHLRQAVSLAPGFAPFHYNLALALKELHRSEESIAVLMGAVEILPDYESLYVPLVELLSLARQDEKAVAIARRLVSVAGGTTSRLLLGKALEKTDRHAEAESLYRGMMEMEPGNGIPHEALGQLLRSLGRFEEAISAFERAIELSPERSGAYLHLARSRKFTESDRPLIDQMAAMVTRGLKDEDGRQLSYALGKAQEDVGDARAESGSDPSGDYRQAIASYDAANRLSHEGLVALGKAFDRKAWKATTDHMVTRFTAGFLKECAGLGLQSDKPVFIVGMPRSGTTLLEQILSRHPEIGAAGEFGTWYALTEGPFRPGAPVTETSIAETGNEFLARLERAAPLARMVTEKSASNYLLLGPIAAVFPSAHIIHCRRNALDTCLSNYSTPFEGTHAHRKEELVFLYKEYLRIMGHWRAMLTSDRFMEIDYEALVANREPVLKRVLSFLKLEWSDACMSHERNESAIRTPSVWQARQPVFSSSVGRWRKFEPWLGVFRELLPDGC